MRKNAFFRIFRDPVSRQQRRLLAATITIRLLESSLLTAFQSGLIAPTYSLSSLSLSKVGLEKFDFCMRQREWSKPEGRLCLHGGFA